MSVPTQQSKIPWSQRDLALKASIARIRGSLKDEGELCRALITVVESKFEGYSPDYREVCSQFAHDAFAGGGIGTQRASHVKVKNIRWLWQDRVPFGKLTVFAGNPDQGKSLVTMYMVAQLTIGAPLEGSDKVLPPFEVLVMAGEDDAEDTIVPRLKSMGADLDKIHLVQSITTSGQGATQEEREVQLDTDIKALEVLLAQHPSVRMIVVDPISNYLGRANMNREQEVRAILIPLKNLAARTGISIVAVMHLNKNSEASAIHRIGGAMAFSGVARAAWMFTENPDDRDEHFMLKIKKNIGLRIGGLKYKIDTRTLDIDGETTYQPYIIWTGATDSSADDLILGSIMGRPSKEKEDAKDWLADFLKDGRQTAMDVEKFGKHAGHAIGTLQRAKDDIGAQSIQEDRRWYWQLPKGGTVKLSSPSSELTEESIWGTDEKDPPDKPGQETAF